jgi:ribosomal 50S subunit-recycling heat shock protein
VTRREREGAEPQEAPRSVRLDVLLHHLCLAKSRSQAAQWIEDGAVQVNDKPARASAPVRVSDAVRVAAGRRTRVYEILALPARGVSRAQAPTYYRLLMDDDSAIA